MIAHFLPIEPGPLMPWLHPSTLVERLALAAGAARPVIRQKGDMIQVFQPGDQSLSDEAREQIFDAATERVGRALVAGLLPAYVQSASNGGFFTIPTAYWRVERKSPDIFEGFTYGIGFDDSMTGQVVLLSAREAANWVAPVSAPHAPEAPVSAAVKPVPRVSDADLSEWVAAQIRDGRTQAEVVKGATGAFPGRLLVHSREDVREIDRKMYLEVTGKERRPGR